MADCDIFDTGPRPREKEEMSQLAPKQLVVARLMREKRNILVCAHAGTGKTSTLIEGINLMDGDIALDGNSGVLFLEFNRNLRHEARKLASQKGLLGKKLDVQNYDSFLVKFYCPSAPDIGFDVAMEGAIQKNLPAIRPISFHAMVVDEAQDLTPLKYDFLCKILRDNAHSGPAQLVLVGDVKQTINNFIGASEKFMLKPVDEWPNVRPEAIVELDLTQTFRFGQNISDVVNTVCRPIFDKRFGDGWYKDIESASRGSSPSNGDDGSNDGGRFFHFVLDPFTSAPPRALLALYADCLADVRQKTEASRASQPRSAAAGQIHTVAVLAHSVWRDSSSQAMWNFVECANRDLGVEHERCEEEDVAGGVTIRTLHTTKGKQYTHVFLFVTNRSMWLEKNAKKGLWIKKHFDTLLYVGLTRATTTLVVVESAESSERVFSTICNAGIGRNSPVLGAEPRRATDGENEEFGVYNPMIVAGPRPKPSLTDQVTGTKPTRRARMEALDSIPRILGVAAPAETALENSGAAPRGDERSTTVSLHETITVLSIVEYRITNSLRALQPIIDWCEDTRSERERGGPPTALRCPIGAYNRICRSASQRVFLPRFLTHLEKLSGSSPGNWSVEFWALICRFHPEFRYGHVSPSGSDSFRPRLVEDMVRRFFEKIGGATQLLLVDPLAVSGGTEVLPKLRNFTISSGLLFVEATSPLGVSYHVPVAISADSPRADDLVAASIASYWLEKIVCLHHLERGEVHTIGPSHGCWALAWKMANTTAKDAQRIAEMEVENETK